MTTLTGATSKKCLASWNVKKKSYLCPPKQGTLAEWLGSGLQNRVQQFESARYLKVDYKADVAQLFVRAGSDSFP